MRTWHARMVSIAAAGIAALWAVALTGCGISLESSRAVSVEGSLAACAPFTPYDDLEALNRALATEPSLLGIAGADIAANVRLATGDLVLAFGDTLLDAPVARETSVRNSLLAISDDRDCLVLGADGGAFVPDRADGVGYWPTSLVEIAPGRTVALFLQRVREAGDGDFVNLGPSIAEVTIDADGLPQLVRVLDIGPDDPSRTRIGWGAASWRADDGYVYVYGTANPEQPLVFGWSLHVARVRADRLFDVAAWEYWTARAWSEDPRDPVTLIPADGGVSQTLSVLEEAGRWYAVSKRDDYLGRDIVVWSASAPMRPFTDPVVVASRPSDLDAGLLEYAAIAHPTLYPQKGSLVVSISRNTTDDTLRAEDPTVYRPQFLRVPLSIP